MTWLSIPHLSDAQPYILLEGEVIVSVNVLENAKEIATLGTGEVFGEMSFIDGRPPSATVETTQNSLVSLFIRAGRKGYEKV